MRRLRCCVWAVLFLFLGGCGGGSLSNSGNGGGGGGTIPAADHVFIVVLENHSFSDVIGNPVMPYLNSLATQNSLAANYFANIHPSIGNYFMLTTGQIVTVDDNFSGVVSDDNLVRALAGAGKTWKAYMESIPSAGYLGVDAGLYLKHHDPFAYFTDVAGSDGQTPTTQAANIVPFSQLATDMAANTLPNFGFIAPNTLHDAHDCPNGALICPDSELLGPADAWLKANIDPLIHSPAFANSVLIITFDESKDTDLPNVGGQVATVLVGSHVKTGFRSTTFYQHQSTLRLVLDLLKVGDRPGLSATATSMNEFFQ
ncbi:MAG TPA: alkaline phosphatase family protein [Verrucomicrobiae bacterium]|nr:alkaline phosphatase family protein [Verrucomicrobiae bacterium]